jgi:hypothetical protein
MTAWDTSDADMTAYTDIIVQDGVFAYNFTASGTIYKGQAVGLVPGMDNTVMTTTAEQYVCDAIGLATMKATDKKQIAVAGPGNICYGCFGSAIAVGSPVYAQGGGVLTTVGTYSTKPTGFVVELPVVKTTNYVGKVLLV